MRVKPALTAPPPPPPRTGCPPHLEHHRPPPVQHVAAPPDRGEPPIPDLGVNPIPAARERVAARKDVRRRAVLEVCAGGGVDALVSVRWCGGGVGLRYTHTEACAACTWRAGVERWRRQRRAAVAVKRRCHPKRGRVRCKDAITISSNSILQRAAYLSRRGSQTAERAPMISNASELAAPTEYESYGLRQHTLEEGQAVAPWQSGARPPLQVDGACCSWRRVLLSLLRHLQIGAMIVLCDAPKGYKSATRSSKASAGQPSFEV